ALESRRTRMGRPWPYPRQRHGQHRASGLLAGLARRNGQLVAWHLLVITYTRAIRTHRGLASPLFFPVALLRCLGLARLENLSSAPHITPRPARQSGVVHHHHGRATCDL